MNGFVPHPAAESAGAPPLHDVPQVSTQLSWRDHLGTLRARLGFFRNTYALSPGLYAVGTPDDNAPVLVTANYKLTFDALRQELEGRAVWLLVLDTRGINVWCAAGKDLFSTKELVRRIRCTGLDRVVRHRRLILPQLAAPGVSGFAVRRATGFSVVFGPVRAADLPAFLESGEVSAAARTVSFTLRERLVLIPVELTLQAANIALVLLFGAILSGLGQGPFWDNVAARFPAFAACTLGAVIAGTVLVPVFLPWIPGRMFGLKGALVGTVLGGLLGRGMGTSALLGSTLWCAALASFLATNFTGSTPFTSPSGVEKELRRWLPLQALGAVVGALVWGFF